MAMVSRCLSVSTSFMLAALRVLHVDTSHARVGAAWIEEWPFVAWVVMGGLGSGRSTFAGEERDRPRGR